MSTAVKAPSELASEDWQITEEDQKPPTALLLQLRRSAHVLPYFRFVCAEGDNAQVKIIFATHLVTVTEHGLAALLAALAAHMVVRLIQPTENEAKFGVRGINPNSVIGPGITDIVVSRIK